MNNFLKSVNDVITDGKQSGILHLNVSDAVLHGNALSIDNRELVNFSSCSYLGLEFDQRLKAGSIQAVENYGTQFSASRAYISSIHYQQLEEKFDAIFDAHSVVAPTTTLGHIAAIPVLVSENDAVILDHQVHNSVQTAASLLKPKGIHVELIRHNKMDQLEARIAELSKKFNKVWYLADGIYSMYGDGTPVEKIYELLNKYERFHFYVDDAHGMSCFGKHGRGYVLNQLPLHRKMVLAVSLAKAFATGGAVLVFPDRATADLVKTCGGPMITSGPMQPGALGAALASADIHLSDEIYKMQCELHENIKYANLMIKKSGLPLIKDLDSPVFFVGVSLPKIGYELIRRMMNDGFYTNLGAFPAVPMKNTGVRFTITRLHTFDQIEGMIESMAHHFDQVVEESDFSKSQIFKAFKMEAPEVKKEKEEQYIATHKEGLIVETYQSINQLDEKEWDSLFKGKGTFDYKGIEFLEKNFKNNTKQEDNWEFDYIIIREKKNNQTVLATFLTTALCKDDMLAHEAVSQKIENIRSTEDPYFLTSRMVMTGSLLTEGKHVYMDETNPLVHAAFSQLYSFATSLQKKYDAGAIMMRDFVDGSGTFDKQMLENGYFKVYMPDNNVYHNLTWNNEDEYLATLSKKERYHVRHEILRHKERFDVEVIKNPSIEDVENWLDLYRQVKTGSYKLNTFDLPEHLFRNIASSENWEALSLRLKTSAEPKEVAVVFCYKSGETYNAMFIGINKEMDTPFSIYRQALYRILTRAKDLGCTGVNFGFTASLEKRRLGATSTKTVAYLQNEDLFNASVIESMQVINKELVTQKMNTNV